MSKSEINPAMDNDLETGVIDDDHNGIADLDNDDLEITVSKIEFPVKPRGVLAE